MQKFAHFSNSRLLHPLVKVMAVITFATAVPLLESCSRTEPKTPEPVYIYLDQNGKPISPPKDLLIVRLDEDGEPINVPQGYYMYKTRKVQPEETLEQLVYTLNHGTEKEQRDAIWKIDEMAIERKRKVDIYLSVYEQEKPDFTVMNHAESGLQKIIAGEPNEDEVFRIRLAYENAKNFPRYMLLDAIRQFRHPEIRELAVRSLSDPGLRLSALKCLQYQQLNTPTIKALERLLYDEKAGWDTESTQDVLTELLYLLHSRGIISQDACNYQRSLSVNQDQQSKSVGMSRAEVLDCRTKFRYPEPFDGNTTN